MAPDAGGFPVRVASSDADLDEVAKTISLAFHEDPTWSWAFPDETRRQAQYAVFWRLLVAGDMRYPWVLLTEGCEAAAVWIPPGGTELSEEDEERVEPLIRDLVGTRVGEVLDLIERFDAAHPRHEPHYYLSLLGTHPAHAGRGLGMGLLAENLRQIDEEGVPAYLESSNPANKAATNGTASPRSASSIRRVATYLLPRCGATRARVTRPAAARSER